MEFIQSVSDWIGVAIFLVSYIFVLTIAFQKSTGWGIGSLFWPIAIIFIFLNYKETSFWAMGMILGIGIIQLL